MKSPLHQQLHDVREAWWDFVEAVASATDRIVDRICYRKGS